MEKKEWIVMQCLNAFRDAQGKKGGEHVIPVPKYDKPMSKADALKALEEVESQNPNLDFRIRNIGMEVS